MSILHKPRLLSEESLTSDIPTYFETFEGDITFDAVDMKANIYDDEGGQVSIPIEQLEHVILKLKECQKEGR